MTETCTTNVPTWTSRNRDSSDELGTSVYQYLLRMCSAALVY